MPALGTRIANPGVTVTVGSLYGFRGKIISKGKWIAAVAAVVVLLGGIGWYIESPIYTLGEMKAAAEANDAEALSSYIDYPALRASLKSQIMAKVRADVARRDQSGLASLEVGLASALIGPLTDAVVSPDGVRAMLLSKQAEEQQRGSALEPPVKLDSDPVIERHGLSEFDVRDRSKNRGALIFRRYGFGWKLSGVELAPESGA